MLDNATMDNIAKFEKLVASAVLSGIICSLAFVFDSLYSSKLKDRLVFFWLEWKPGATIFTRIKDGKMKDDRISTEKALEKYKEIINSLPTAKKKRYEIENNNWHSIYTSHKDDASVGSTHRNRLLCRDLYITTISMTVFTAIAMTAQMLPFSWILFGYLFLMLVVTNMAARNKASRFVNTVISKDVALIK
jgi:hypothetical protein